MFIVSSVFLQWFQTELRPIENYILIKEDLSDLVEQLNWTNQNEDKVQEIMNRGCERAKEIFTIENVFLQYLKTIKKALIDHQIEEKC